ncbi:hypothetical protein pah_c188o052 [Parachlamydia acanthamoebae str. Hall's coccus]|jgi:hypothetical protein|nr:hypothetical protein pah_c188o052 [Parachlamydia acanthamoebae str. Hall's coccus]
MFFFAQSFLSQKHTGKKVSMDPIGIATDQIKKINESITPSSHHSEVTSIAQNIFSKYPSGSMVTKLTSTFEIKQTWLYNEWSPECQFSKYIRPTFPKRADLSPKNENPNIALIESIFQSVRGQFQLWKSEREEARWRKVEINALEIDWMLKNVEILFPSEEQFQVSELRGIVLWKNPPPTALKRYQLYEGNHRISAWKTSQIPKRLPATIFIGKPKKEISH